MIKSIPFADGYYVDDQGNVYSKWINKGVHGLAKGSVLKKLKCSTSKSGHVTVRFGRKNKAILVHRLVYEVFNGEIPDGLVVRHINDVPNDNRLINLKLGTQKDNMSDAMINGIFPLGEKNGQSKLTAEQVKLIKVMSPFKSQAQLGREFNVSRKTIAAILEGRTWKHVKIDEVI